MLQFQWEKSKLQAIDCFVLIQISLNPSCIQSGYQVLGFTELIFIDPGVKINDAYYRDVLLCEHLLSDVKELLGSEFFIFQQDSVSAHRARETVNLLSRETPDFISPTLWPPIALISMGSTTRYGASFKNVFIKPAYTTLTISNSDLWKNGIVLIKELLIVQSMNGEIALEHVFELMAGILNISFEEQHLTQINFSCFCWIVEFNKK